MKKYLCILFAICSFNAYSQINDSGDSISSHKEYLQISTNNSETEAFKKVGRILIDNDFDIKFMDKDLLYIVTELKETFKHDYIQAKVSIHVDSGKTIIRISGKRCPTTIYQNENVNSASFYRYGLLISYEDTDARGSSAFSELYGITLEYLKRGKK